MAEPRWSYYYSGEVVGTVKVIKLMTAGQTMGKTEYLCEWTCCGGHEVMTHLKIRKEMRKGVSMCAKCRSKLGFLTAASYAEAKPESRHTVFACGHYWPSLGPMGPRHGTTGRY